MLSSGCKPSIHRLAKIHGCDQLNNDITTVYHDMCVSLYLNMTQSEAISCVLCLFRQVQASSDASLLYRELFFFICSYSMSLFFIQSIIVALCVPRVLVPYILPSKTVRRRIYFSAHDLTNFSVFVRWYSEATLY